MTKAVADAFRKAGYRSVDLGAGRAYCKEIASKQVLTIAPEGGYGEVPRYEWEPCHVWLDDGWDSIEPKYIGGAPSPFGALMLAQGIEARQGQDATTERLDAPRESPVAESDSP